MPTPSLTARQLAADIIDRWAKGEAPDTRAALEQHPGLTADKAAVLDLAFAEYWLRVHAGEAVDLETFCRRFPAYHISLGRLLAQQSLKDPPALAETVEQATIPLPTAPAAVEPAPKPSTEKAGRSSAGSTHGGVSGAWPEAGAQIGDYNLVRALGKGAFSRVYLAREETVDRTVVVKLSRQQCDEAKVLGQLGHKNVVSVLSAPHDMSSGLFIIVMPYHGNSTLEDLLEVAFPLREESDARQRPRTAATILDAARRNRQATDPEPADLIPDAFLRRANYVDGVVWLGVRMAEALSAVHRSGFVHHDLKPSNVLLGLDGQPRLLDFNLASDARNTKSRLGGTLPYMPPEHLETLRAAVPAAHAAVMDHRGDLFSLGVMLYELLAGTHPFGRYPKSKSVRSVAADILARQKLGVRPIRDRNPDVSPRLARLVDQCLAFDPTDRPPTASDVAVALRRCFSPQKKAMMFLAGAPGRSAVVASSIGLLSAVGWMTTARAGSQELDLPGLEQRGLNELANGRTATGVAYLLPVAEARPDNVKLAVTVARGQIQEGSYAGAGKRLEQAVKRQPGDNGTKALYAFTLTKTGAWETAETVLRHATAAGDAPDNVLALHGYVLVQRRKDAEADALLRGVLARKPDHWPALANLVYLRHAQALGENRLAQAETFADVDRLVRGAPADPEMYLWAAKFYAWAARRPAHAVTAWHPEPEHMKAECVEMLRMAAEAGLPPEFWKNDTTFRVLLGEPAAYAAAWKLPAQPASGRGHWRSGRPDDFRGL